MGVVARCWVLISAGRPISMPAIRRDIEPRISNELLTIITWSPPPPPEWFRIVIRTITCPFDYLSIHCNTPMASRCVSVGQNSLIIG